MKKGLLTCRCTTVNLLAPSGSPIQKMMLPKQWKGIDFPKLDDTHKMRIELQGDYIWTDGTNIYFTYAPSPYDGVYLGDGTLHVVLNGDTWEPATMNWGELDGFNARGVWTDGTNIYHSYYCYTKDIDAGYCHYVLSDGKWVTKAWNGLTEFSAENIWTDGTNIYHSSSETCITHVLNGDTWTQKTWGSDTYPNGRGVWSDGVNIYSGGYSYGSAEGGLILNGDTWEVKTWTFSKEIECGGMGVDGALWTDGESIFLTNDKDQFVLNGDTWEAFEWSGITAPDDMYFRGTHIWTDGNAFYFSYEYTNDNPANYVFLPTTAKLYSRANGEWVKLGSVT